MGIDRQRVLDNVRAASTADLLERVTVFRSEMEPAAIVLIESELMERGVGLDEIAAERDAKLSAVLVGPDGYVLHCVACRGPATLRRTGWYRLFGLVPVYPVSQAFCPLHGN